MNILSGDAIVTMMTMTAAEISTAVETGAKVAVMMMRSGFVETSCVGALHAMTTGGVTAETGMTTTTRETVAEIIAGIVTIAIVTMINPPHMCSGVSQHAAAYFAYSLQPMFQHFK